MEILMHIKREFLRINSMVLIAFYIAVIIFGDLAVSFAQSSDAVRSGRIVDGETAAPKRISDAPAPQTSKTAAAASTGASTSETLIDKALKTVTAPKFIGGNAGSGAAGLAGDVAGKVLVKGATKAFTGAGTKIAAKAGTKVALKTASKVLLKTASLASYAVPGVGPVLGSFVSEIFSNVGEATIGSVAEDIGAKKTPSFKKAIASIDWSMVMVKSVGGVLGSIALTALCPPLGIVAVIGGSMIGAFGAELLMKGFRKLTAPKDDKKNAAGRQGLPASGLSSDGTVNESSYKPPTADSGLNSCLSTADGSVSTDAKAVYEKMRAHYSNYTGLVAAGKGDSAEANSELTEYKKLLDEYSKLKK